jgi:hypothetical protein
MSEPERKALIALVLMVDQYLSNGRILDNLAMHAGEMALQVLAEHGLVTLQPGTYRFAHWTEAGRQLLTSQRLPNRTETLQ